MHFWINKPAGRYYGFAGRPYPATPLPKARSGNRRRGREAIRPMATRVHRFQSLNGVSSHAPGSSHSSNYGPRHSRPVLRNVNDNTENISLQLVRQPNTGNIVPNSVGRHRTESAVDGRPQLTPNIAADTTQSGRFPDFSDLTDAELAGCRLRCGVWITFVLAAGFVVAAKFYFDHQGTGLEVLVYCGLLVTLLLSGCFYSMLCQRIQDGGVVRNNLTQVEGDPIAVQTATNTIANETIGLPVLTPVTVVGQNPPPPPYHIAILIPPSNSGAEIPPPSYDKVTVH